MNEDTGYKWTKTDVFSVIAAIVVLVIGYYVSRFIQNSMSIIPEGFGPPAIVPWIPFIMSSIPLILCIFLMATANRRHRAKMEAPTVYRYSDETIVYTGDYEVDSEPEKEEKVYLIPAQCPSCNRPISSETVEWTGPLQAKCPHCGSTVKAEERE